jgi:hypothetical protein
VNVSFHTKRRGASRARCVGPVFVNGDHVVIRWHFKFEGLDGTVSELEELAYQHWRGERILAGQFFYDPGRFGKRGALTFQWGPVSNEVPIPNTHRICAELVLTLYRCTA